MTNTADNAYVNSGFEQEGIAECVNVKLNSGKKSSSNNDEVSIAWRNLRMEVRELSGWKLVKKPILRRLNGYFVANSLNGLMGPSGAGKTTLLNVLSGSARSGICSTSEIYLNSTSTSQVSYFIEQHVHENIVGQMSVGQVLRYAFRFKNGSSDEAVMNEHVRKTMAQLMLPSDLVSRPFSKCSGGEQKRVAIAQELMSLTKPSFLFVDEPTTGLDSAAALQVVQCLKSLTQTHRITIIASIHAPNNEMLNLFDKLYVLAKGGVCIYSGAPQQIQLHLEQQTQHSIPEEQPPIEALLKIACNGIHDQNVINLANGTLNSEHSAVSSHLSSLSYQSQGIPSPRKIFSISNFFLELLRLCRITFVSKKRSIFMTCLLFVIYFGVMCSIFNHEMASARGCYPLEDGAANSTCTSANLLDDDLYVKQNGHYLSYVLMMVGFVFMSTSSAIYSTHVKIFRSEHRNHWYSLGVFYWSASIVSFLQLNLYTSVITSISYFLSNQQAADNFTINWARFGYYHLFVWLLCIYAESVGALIGIILVNHVQIAMVFCQILYSASSLFNGLYVRLERVGNPTLVKLLTLLSDQIGLVHITKGIYYACYGIDRCDRESEYSWVLVDYSVEEDRIIEYVARVLLNVVVLRAITLAYMYFKFNSFGKGTKGKEGKECPKQGEPIHIDYNLDHVKNGNNNHSSRIIDIIQTEYEIIFNNFSKYKILIAWRNLTLYGSNSIFENGPKGTRQEMKPILRNLNGQFRIGTLNALMGTSGAGKTSLLKVLNGRCKTRLSESTRFYLSKFTKITTCFITQEVSGHLMPGLTAKQMLVYASRLKNANENVDHEAIAIGLLNKLDLANTESTRVERCSGGERKRLALALELTSRQIPNLVCIDEPTSGLDSNSAEIVISCLRKLTHAHNLTIIASIHQPNTEILAMFDQLYVLARGGVCVYSGPPNQIQTHLAKIPEIKPVESKFAIEVLIKHSCSGHQDEIIHQLAQLNDHQYSKTEVNEELSEQTQSVPDGVVPNRQRFSLCSVLNLSLRFMAYVRGYLWMEWTFSLFNYIGYGVALLLFYNRKMIYVSGCINLEDDLNNSCSKTSAQVEDEFLLTDNMRYTYFFTNIYLLIILIGASLNFYREYAYFENEHRNGWYSSGSFYLMKSIFEILPLIPVNLIYAYIVDIYAPVVPGGLYWPLVFLLTIAAIGFQGMAHCFSLIGGGDLQLQSIILICINLLLIVIGNFFIPVSKMHYIYQFLSNFSISRFTFEAVMLLEYGFGRCRPKEIQAILYSMSLEDADYYGAIRMLFFNLVFYRVVAIWLLLWRANPVENRRKRVSRIEHFRDNMQPAIGVYTGIDSAEQQFQIHQTRC